MMGFGYRLYPSYELRVSLSLRMGWIASANSRYAIIPYRLNRRTALKGEGFERLMNPAKLWDK